jgi:PAS domain S-box-containing protein
MFQDGGYFSYVNPRMVNLLGYDSADEIIGKPFWEFIAPVDRELVKTRGLEREKREINPRRYKFRMIKKNGEEIWVDMRASHASYLGRPATVGNFIDVTREIKAEEQIRQLTRRLIDGIEEERRSLANDIHDEFGQLLTLLQFDIELLQNTLPPALTESVDICTKMMRQIQKLAEAVRDTTSRLRPDMLDHLGLVPTLKWYITDIHRRRPATRISFQSFGLKKRLPPEIELVLYRVFQEGLNNISKHANASQVNLQLTYNHPDIIFMIKDDGCGFIPREDGLPAGSNRKGIGLLSMKERVTSLGGSMAIHSTPGKGTALRIKIPMNERKSNETD